MIACDNIDEVIHIIRSSASPDEARTRLGESFGLDEIQTRAIVEMRLRQLTGLEMDKLHAEYDELQQRIAEFKLILEDDNECRRVMKEELIEIRDKYGDERRTRINMFSGDLNAEDFYPDDEMIITISHLGYIKRTPLSEFRTQNRGGIGVKGSDTRDSDFIEHIYPATNHNYMLFFTRKGRCYWLKVYEIPEGARNTKGRAIQNLLNIDSDDAVNAYIRIKHLDDKEYVNTHNLVFCTRRGIIKKTSLEAYSRPRANGVNAIILRDDDQLIEVRLTDGNNDIIIADRAGRAIRFHESKVREMGRVTGGVRGMTLAEGRDDEVIGMIVMKPEPETEPQAETPEQEVENKEVEKESQSVLVVSQKGYGKRSSLDDYRITNRGGKGVATMKITDKTGDLVAIKNVSDNNDLVIINQSGITLRLPVSGIRVMGRNTQGVKLIDLKKRSDVIASVCKVPHEEAETPEEDDEAVKEEAPAVVPEVTDVVEPEITDVEIELSGDGETAAGEIAEEEQ